jgi:hypothetical protein
MNLIKSQKFYCLSVSVGPTKQIIVFVFHGFETWYKLSFISDMPARTADKEIEEGKKNIKIDF